MPTVILDAPLTWRDIAAVADGATLELSPAARTRIATARAVVEALVDRSI